MSSVCPALSVEPNRCERQSDKVSKCKVLTELWASKGNTAASTKVHNHGSGS